MGEIFTAVLGVIGILCLIAAGTFIIIFLSDLVISIIEGKKGIFFSRKSENAKVKIEENEQVSEQQKALTFNDEFESVDLKQAELERQLMEEKNSEFEDRQQLLSEKQVEDVEDDKVSKEEENLDALYAQLIAEVNDEISNQKNEEEDLELEEIINSIEDEDKEEAELEEVEDDEEETETEEVKNLKAELEELKNLLAKEKEEKAKAEEEKDNLAKELEEKQTVVVEDGESLESLLERKGNLEERLKITEKELKQNKKEYIPLSRIKRTLENDEAKLRRREAIVAKKKIVLFGVNNYVVDPEKEQQLANDLDALEALRLSVQHCEEVIKENEDRYPILENTNKILTKTVEDLKADLEKVEAKIKAITDKDAE